MMTHFIEYMREHKYIEDDMQIVDKDMNEFFQEFSYKVFEYAEKNHIPYDLKEYTTEFCVEGAILSYEDMFLAFEIHSGQGTVGVCYIPNEKEIIKISNFITMEDIKCNRPHKKIREYNLIECARRIEMLFDIKEIAESDIEKVFDIIRNKRR